MKILFAVQGTGNGHFSRAQDVYSELIKYGDVDVLVSGIQVDVIPSFPVKHSFYGMSLIFGRHGAVDILQTIKQLKLFRLCSDIRNFSIQQYDLVISDYEPISAWACKLRKLPCISLSHQSALMSKKVKAPFIEKIIGRFMLRYYAPCTTNYGFDFEASGENIFTPLIKKEIRALNIANGNHYTVYLPSYEDEIIIKHLSRFPTIEWQVFSKHCKQSFELGTITVNKINSQSFIKSMTTCAGLLCGAGFQSISEALYLGKKLLVIPMRMQYEQYCNALSAADMGVTTIKELNQRYYPIIRKWLENGDALAIHYPDLTANIVAKIIKEHRV